MNIQQVKNKLDNYFQFNQLQTLEQIQNIIEYNSGLISYKSALYTIKLK